MEELNREYKDSVFRSIFGTCEEASEHDLALYKALTGDTNVSVSDIRQVQLDDIVTGGMHNDVAFTVKGRMIFMVEHQSTRNPNMPLRMLFYFDKELRKKDNQSVQRSGTWRRRSRQSLYRVRCSQRLSQKIRFGGM